jgi:hypothetical protein
MYVTAFCDNKQFNVVIRDHPGQNFTCLNIYIADDSGTSDLTLHSISDEQLGQIQTAIGNYLANKKDLEKLARV